MGAAELSRGAGFADRDLGRKILVADPSTIPGYIVIDGKALATTPVNILTSTAMGQLRIAIEMVYSTKHNPISDGMALHTIRLLAENLPHCHELEVDRLLLIKTAACMASLAGVGGLGLNTPPLTTSAASSTCRTARPTQSCCPTPCVTTQRPAPTGSP